MSLKGMNRRNRAQFIGTIVFIALMGVLTVVGVYTHTEPGFTEQDRHWRGTPLTVACAGHVPAEDDACEVAEHAVGVVNARLGFGMLSWLGRAADADIKITMRAPVEVGVDEPGGHYELHYANGVYSRCEVRTMNSSGGGTDLEWLVVYHELGHCLGLAHDTAEISIMRPNQRATPFGQIPPWISDYDRKILRERYRR